MLSTATCAPPDWDNFALKTGDTIVSDMTWMAYLGALGEMPFGNSFLTGPTRIRDPPCDEQGVELVPLVFHLSHYEIKTHYSGADRAGVMRDVFATLRRNILKCTPAAAAADGAAYFSTNFPPAEDSSTSTELHQAGKMLRASTQLHIESPPPPVLLQSSSSPPPFVCMMSIHRE